MKILGSPFDEAIKLLNLAWTEARAITDPDAQRATKTVIQAMRALVQETDVTLRALADHIPEK